MRLIGTFVAFLLLAGCNQPQTFDQRYNDTATEIANRAATIDRDLFNATSNIVETGASNAN